ncbi:MAG: ornithine cyclodeaminase [Paludibacteraceae bacterium]|nr:ornithine cyclodeaminase [Paludibacteraceae bacterium]
MKHITTEEINNLSISPAQCVEWVKEAFCLKYDAQLPPKISLHPQGNDFFNTMPCLLPALYDRFGVKVVSRIAGNKPSLHSDLLLYEASSGKLLSFMDADWITQMRTGAVAALAIQTLQSKDAQTYAFVGLGSTAIATMQCLAAIIPSDNVITCKLLKYKDQAEKFAYLFSAYSNLQFVIVETNEDLVKDSDVIVSAVTEMTTLFCADNNLYKKGVLVVPIHTRGFQNCDLFFDHVFADDTAHVSGFKYFNQFRQFNELSEVLLGTIPARQSNDERILAYNIGLGLHDIYFANKIYERLTR